MIKNLTIADAHNKSHKLLPSAKNIREKASFNIDGTQYANTYRRVLLEELYAYFLDFELGEHNVTTTDDFFIDDMFKDRLNSLIINQVDDNLINIDIPANIKKIKMEINVTNDTSELIYVTAGDIKGGSNAIVFHEHVRLIGLNPGCSLVIKNIFVNKKN